MVKTCQVTSHHRRYDSRVYLKTAVSLAKAGYESHLLIADDQEDEIKDGVIIHSTHYHFKSTLDRVWHAYKKMRKMALAINADIYQFHEPEFYKLGLYLKKHGKKVIFDAHEDFSAINDKNWVPKPLRKIVKYFYLKKEKKSLKKFDALIGAADFIVERLKPINNNITLISNYPCLVDKYEHDFSSCSLIFGGGSDTYYQLPVIDALEHFHGQVTYTLVSNASEETLKKWQQSPGWKYVSYHPWMSHEELRKLYQKASIGLALVIPRENTNGKKGTLGVIKLFEFMNEGLPVITTNLDRYVELIEGHHAGFCIDIEQPESIITTLQQFLDNPSLYKEMGDNGRRLVEEEYNWPNQEKKLLKIYEEMTK